MGTGPDQGVSLRLFNGSVQFGYDRVGVVSTAEEVLEVDQWYQLYASRFVSVFAGGGCDYNALQLPVTIIFM